MPVLEWFVPSIHVEEDLRPLMDAAAMDQSDAFARAASAFDGLHVSRKGFFEKFPPLFFLSTNRTERHSPRYPAHLVVSLDSLAPPPRRRFFKSMGSSIQRVVAQGCVGGWLSARIYLFTVYCSVS